LHASKRLPGTADDGSIDKQKLKGWIVETRRLCQMHGREQSGDSMMGELLANSRSGSDGLWPHESVRDVLEEVGTSKIANGMSIGRYNARGAHFRAREGGEERALAAQYRDWAKRVSFDWPFTAQVLERLAQSYDHEAAWHDKDDNLQRRVMD
jgi:hypothetical protein